MAWHHMALYTAVSNIDFEGCGHRIFAKVDE